MAEESTVPDTEPRYTPPVQPGGKYQPDTDKKGLAKSILLVFLGLLLFVAGMAGTWTIQQNRISEKQDQIATLQDEVKTLKEKAKALAVNEDETKDWKTYNDTVQKFSIKYPPTWVTLNECEGVGSIGFHTAPAKDYLAVCQSDKASLVTVSSEEGDKRADYTVASPEFQTEFKKEQITLNNIQGEKVSFTDNGQGLRNAGTKNVIYVFFTNNRTYAASYTQEQNYPDELDTFNTMVTKTLTFN